MNRRTFLYRGRTALLAPLCALFAWPALSFVTWRRERFAAVVFSQEEQYDHCFKDGVYLVHSPGGLRALSARCPHLGCTVAYDERRREFRCPCHRSVFNAQGVRLRGPAAGDLQILQAKRVEGGALQALRPL
jgi:Rieske Fe-S protein